MSKRLDKIFVAISSYRDSDCPNTLENLFSMAEYPNRISVGITQQNTKEDPECVYNTNKNAGNYNIRYINIDAKDAKGPMFARSLCVTLIRDEYFFFQIDAHQKFVHGWDSLLINMYNKLINDGHQKIILSHYTSSIENYPQYLKDPTSITTTPVICKSFFHADHKNILSFEGASELNSLPEISEVHRNLYIAGGFIFAPVQFIKDIHYSEIGNELLFGFIGEEILVSLLAFSHGWDVFTPNQNITFHFYTRENFPKYWSDTQNYKSEKEKESKQKILDLLYLRKSPLKKFLGTERTISDFYKFGGIDIKNKTINKDFCDPIKKKGKMIEHFSVVNMNSRKKGIFIGTALLGFFIYLVKS